MTKRKSKTFLVGVIERAISYYEVRAEDARTTAAVDFQHGLQPGGAVEVVNGKAGDTIAQVEDTRRAA